MIKTFFSYMGNKTNLLDMILPSIPQHTTYVEVFGGTGAVLLNKQRSKYEIYNDYNSMLVSLFNVVRTRPEEFLSHVELFLNSEQLHKQYYKEITSKEYSESSISNDLELDIATKYFFVMSTVFRARFGAGYNYSLDESCKNVFMNKYPYIMDIHKRIKNCVILNKSYKDLLKSSQLNSEDVFIYLDPPYVDTEYAYKNAIESQFTIDDHVNLFNMLKNMKSKWMLSYEDDEFIRELYSDFFFKEKDVNRPQKGDSVSTEIIIMNYKTNKTLFD